MFPPLQKGENTSLIVERMKKLEELGFSWSVGRGSGSAKDERGICSNIVRREKTFQSSLAESADFKSIHGHMRVSCSTTNKQYATLAGFVSKVRLQYACAEMATEN